MLRPNLIETLAGLARTVGGTLAPELQSPYARSQALVVMGVTSATVASMSVDPECEAAELADLKATLKALKGADLPEGRGELAAMMSEFAAELGAGKLSPEAAELTRGYLRRHVSRVRQACAPGLTMFGLNTDWCSP